MKYYVQTDTGKVRKLNEDYYYIDKKYNIFFMVADGMGGHNAGDVASKMSVNVIKNYFNENFDKSMSNDELISLLKKSIGLANEEVLKVSNKFNKLYGMGTTVSCVFVRNNEAVFINIGDSRGYVFYDSEIKQITVDHSLVAEMVQEGRISEDEARKHPQKNIITSCIGSSEDYKIDAYKIPIVKGMKIMLCTDGLSNLLESSEMKEIVEKNENNIEKSVNEMIEKANEYGGFDNITIIMINPS